MKTKHYIFIFTFGIAGVFFCYFIYDCINTKKKNINNIFHNPLGERRKYRQVMDVKNQDLDLQKKHTFKENKHEQLELDENNNILNEKKQKTPEEISKKKVLH